MLLLLLLLLLTDCSGQRLEFIEGAAAKGLGMSLLIPVCERIAVEAWCRSYDHVDEMAVMAWQM
jgi:hypothetical protein